MFSKSFKSFFIILFSFTFIQLNGSSELRPENWLIENGTRNLLQTTSNVTRLMLNNGYIARLDCTQSPILRVQLSGCSSINHIVCNGEVLQLSGEALCKDGQSHNLVWVKYFSSRDKKINRSIILETTDG